MMAAAAASAAVDAVYYAHAGKLPLVRRVSYAARRRVCQLFFDVMRPSATDRVLDVGVSDEVHLESNMLEQMFPHRGHLTCASLTDGCAIERAYPGVFHTRIVPHEPLPFADGAFDLVYSNAVLEHAGTTEQQRFFLAELCRVGRRVFVAVPNRLFPVEHHTGLPLVNYLPPPLFRRLLRDTRYDAWSYEANLHYVSADDLRALWPGPPPYIAYTGLGLGTLSSNIAAYSGE